MGTGWEGDSECCGQGGQGINYQVTKAQWVILETVVRVEYL